MPSPIDVSVQVKSPATRVWKLITDLDNAPGRIKGIVELERLDSETGFDVGTRWRETRTMYGKTATEEMTVTEVDEGRSYTSEAQNRGVKYIASMSVTSTGPDTCELSMHFDAKVSGFLNKTLGAVVGKMMAGTTRKMMLQDLQDIADAAEAMH